MSNVQKHIYEGNFFAEMRRFSVRRDRIIKTYAIYFPENDCIISHPLQSPTLSVKMETDTELQKTQDGYGEKFPTSALYAE